MAPLTVGKLLNLNIIYKKPLIIIILTLIVNVFLASCKESSNTRESNIIISEDKVTTTDYLIRSTQGPNYRGKSTLVRYKSDSSLFSGVVTDSFGYGFQNYEYRYKEGRKNGLSKEWYENGRIKSEENYKNGLLNGLCKRYYDNWQLSFEINYKNGEYHGKWQEWDRDGNLTYNAEEEAKKLEQINKFVGRTFDLDSYHRIKFKTESRYWIYQKPLNCGGDGNWSFQNGKIILGSNSSNCSHTREIAGNKYVKGSKGKLQLVN